MTLQEMQPGTHGTLAHKHSVAVPFVFLTIWIIVVVHTSESLQCEESGL